MTTLTLDARLATDGPGPIRTWLVELRKLVDTRSGITLVITGAVLAGVFGGGALLFRDPLPFTDLVTLAGVPGGVMAAVAAVLLVTAERTHRTALSTYALIPDRGRVIAAKAGAAITLAIMVTLLALAAALVIAPVGTALTGHEVTWTVDWRGLGAFTGVNMTLALTGWALAYLTGNAPTPIVVLLVWPMVSSLVSQAGPNAAEVMSWLDPGAVNLLAADTTLADLGRIGTALAAWVVVPAVIGIVRELRSEVR